MKRRFVKTLALKSENHLGDQIFFWMIKTFALLFILLFISLFVIISVKSWPAFKTFGFSFFVNPVWDSWKQEFGVLALVYGTFVSSILALLIAVPISLALALFLNELAPRWLAVSLGFVVEMLAAIPSIIYGMWGLFVLAPFLRNTIQPFLSERFSYIPLFSGSYYGVGMMSAGLILAIMIIPTISSLSKEILKGIPFTNKEAVLSLGSTRWEMFRIALLKGGASGIMGAVFLGFGRAFGETMAVTMVIGNKVNLSPSLFAPSQTMASVLATQYAEADNELHLSALTAVGLTLFVVTLLFNSVALGLVWRMKKKWNY